MKKMSSTTMKIMGATFAVCSAAAMMGSMKPSGTKAMKKTMKNAAEKMVGFVDTVASIM